MDGAPRVSESRRWCKTCLIPHNTRLAWLWPLLLPWRVREGWVASSGPAAATGFGEEAEGGDCGIQQHTEKKKEKPSVTFCPFHFGLLQAACSIPPFSQSTSGTAVLAGSKPQDTAPQVVPVADERGHQTYSWEGQE